MLVTEKVLVVDNMGIKGVIKLVLGVQGRLPWEIISRFPRVKGVKWAPKHELSFLHLLEIKEGSVFSLFTSSISYEDK